MSSFVGHSLAGLLSYAMIQQAGGDRAQQSHQLSWIWLAWLLVVASFPDIDHVIPGLRVPQADQTMRITHSFLGVLLLPGCTMLGLWLRSKRGKTYQLQSSQVVLAGLSHLLLDLLTGAFALPLLYPFSTQMFKLPFGLLPSAGRIQLTNYFLYRNLLIELGVLIPLSLSLLLIIRGATTSRQSLFAIVTGFVISGCFMVWAFTLSR